MSTDQVKIIVRKYADVLKKHGVLFSNVYLFGSYAKGQAKIHSDIDVAVVVKKAGHGKEYLEKKCACGS